MEHTPELEGHFQALLKSSDVTPPTRRVLQKRLEHTPITVSAVFSVTQFQRLKTVCALLVPQNPESNQVDLPGLLDQQLNTADGKGWRYDTMPPEKEAFLLGMEGIEEEAATLFNASFINLSEDYQRLILQNVQNGNVEGEIWKRIPSARFFEELLVALVELYYSHPFAKIQIGDQSFADAHGWTSIGLGEMDKQELPSPTKS